MSPQFCINCGVRWSQSKLGLCRQCERSTAADLRSTIQRERDQVARRRRKLELLERVNAANFAAWRASKQYDRVADGVEYTVVWHGALDGPRNRTREPAPDVFGRRRPDLNRSNRRIDLDDIEP